MGLSDECQNEAISLLALRDIAEDIADKLAHLNLPEHYSDMLKVQLGHVRRSGYLSDAEYYDLKNLVADIEAHLPAEPLPELKTLADIEERGRKLEQSLSEAERLKNKTQDAMFQKVVACELKWRR